MKDLDEGFYYLTSEQEPDPVLVHGYNCTDLDGKFIFGFNLHDGGQFVALDDLTKDTTVTAVSIVEEYIL